MSYRPDITLVPTVFSRTDGRTMIRTPFNVEQNKFIDGDLCDITVGSILTWIIRVEEHR